MNVRSIVDADDFQFIVGDSSGAALSGLPARLPLVIFDLETPEFVSVLTGAHMGSVGVSSACLDAPPASVGEGWEEVAEISVTCTSGLSIGALMGGWAHALCAEAGTYRLRISARGRAEAAEDFSYDDLTDEPSNADPIEEYLIEAWAAPMEDAHMLRSPEPAFADRGSTATPEHGGYAGNGAGQRRDAAQLAGQRIRVDLDDAQGARPLTGQLGAVTFRVVLPREIARVWPLIASLDITNMGSGSEDACVGSEFRMSTYMPQEEGFVGTDGEIICRWTELQKPTRVAMTWRWTRTIRDPGATTLTATLTDRTTEPAQPVVELELINDSLPTEWIEDMTAVWVSKLDQWAFQSVPRKRRR